MIDLREDFTTNAVAKIRQLRRHEKTIKSDLEKAERAYAFGMDTGNFVPFLCAAGRAWEAKNHIGPNTITEVPKDWQPPEPSSD